MATYTEAFKSLADQYLDTPIEFPGLRAVTVAQWILESGYGQSRLAKDHLNFGGLKWRPEMQGFATPVRYEAHDGADDYCKFASIEKFILGYWHFLDRSPYRGWRNHADSASSFIEFIGPIYTPTHLYSESVLSLLPAAEALLDDMAGEAQEDHHDAVHGTNESPAKPPIKSFVQSPHHSARNGIPIRRVIMHYTTSRNMDGTIQWFLDPISRVSAHYVIGRDGTIVQMVRDSDKAWHAKGANADSIGIEHSAAKGDQMTPAQELSSVALVRWLLSEYKLTKSAIHGHKYTPENAGTTDCPNHLFGADSETAIDLWVRDRI